MPNLIRPEGPEPEDFRFSRRALATGMVGGLAFAGYAPRPWPGRQPRSPRTVRA